MPFIPLTELPEIEPVPGFRGRFAHGDRMTLALWDIDEGAALPEHTHPHEQISSVVEGRFEMTLQGETRILDPGTVAVIPADAPHGGHALTPCRIIDAFCPARDDYR